MLSQGNLQKQAGQEWKANAAHVNVVGVSMLVFEIKSTFGTVSVAAGKREF